MSWDEHLFKKLLVTTENIFSKKKNYPEWHNRIELSSCMSRMNTLARVLTGKAIEIKEAENEGGIDGSVFLLPSTMDLYADPKKNAKAYLFRTVLASYLFLDPSDSIVSLDVLLGRICEDLPLFSILARELGVLPGIVPHPKLLGRLGKANSTGQASQSSPNKNELPISSLSTGTQKKGKPREKVELVELGEETLDTNPLVHVFEKVRTAEEYDGGKKSLDGSDELEDHADALEELNLRRVIRTRERTSSVYKSDVFIEGAAPDLEDDSQPGAISFVYDEWSGKNYKKDWCTLFEERRLPLPDPKNANWSQEVLARNRRQIDTLKKKFARLLNRPSWKNRQTDGSEVDIDALTDRYAALKSGSDSSDKFYQRRIRTHSDFAIYVLLDSSLTTDSWISNRRTLDVERESVWMLAQGLEGVCENVGVGSFYSNTRKDCRFQILKDFRDPWNKLALHLSVLEPRGYTRIGPALRHATHLLEGTGAKKKLLLLVSDGKPTDYDRYEGSYGVADVRQAFREANERNVHLRALAIDAQAKFYLPEMFGQGNFQILSHPRELVPALSRVFLKYV